MTILGMWTADLQTKSLPYSTIHNDTIISSDYARTGTYSFKCQDNRYHYFSLFNNSKTVYFRIALLSTGTITSAIQFCMYSGTGSSTSSHLRVELLQSSLVVYAPYGTLRESVSYSFALSTWHLLEIYLYVDNSTGAYEIRWDGDSISSASNIDTQNTSEDTVSTISFWNRPTYLYSDDIMVRDDDWCGAGGLHVLTPNAGTSQEDWGASAGNPEDCVDELPVSYTDYIYASADVAGSGHRFGITTLPSDITNIGGIGVFRNTQSTDTIAADVRSIIYSGTTQGNGSGILLSTSQTWNVDYWDNNPDDAAAWEKADIDALEIGVETLA